MRELGNLISARESESVECKESWNDDCLKALTALANTQGGTLLVGVADDGRVVGWSGDGKEQERVANQITATLQVHPISMTVLTEKGHRMLVIEMARAASPIALRGRYYRRVGNSSRELPAEELRRFLLERTGQTWDALPSEIELDEIDPATIAEFRALAQERLPALTVADTTETVLSKLQLTLSKQGRLKRAALLLFGSEPQGVLPSAMVQIGRFRNNSTTILDDKRVTGNLFQQVRGVEQALRNLLAIRYEFPNGSGDHTGLSAFQREEIWEYPYRAVREAVLNALIHRDYTSTGRILIRIYDDRMQISNPGGLPDGLTVEDLYQSPHDTLPRNPILAQICYYADLVEHWGSGTLRMIEACREQGMPKPEFVSTPTGFSVTLRKDELSDAHLRQLGMNERQIQAVHFVQQQGSISNAQHQQLTDSSRRTALRDLEQLEAVRVFKRSAPSGRTVRYVLEKRVSENAPNAPLNAP